MASIAGKKAGMKQGEIGGILKDLGYTEDQVYSLFSIVLKTVTHPTYLIDRFSNSE